MAGNASSAAPTDTAVEAAIGAGHYVGAPRPKRERAGRVVALVRPHWPRFAVATTFLILGSGIGLVYPQAIRMVIDRGIDAESIALLDQVFGGLLALFVLQAALTWARHYLMSWLGERAVADLRAQVMERIILLPARWFQERRTGELVGRIAGDVTIIEGVVGSELSMAMRYAVQLVGGLVMLLFVDLQLTIIMLAVVPPMIVAVLIFGRRIRRMSRQLHDEIAATNARVQEVFGAITTVQSFVQEPTETTRYAGGVERIFARSLALARWRATFMSTASLLGFLGIAGIIWLGGRRVAAGLLSPGDLTAFLLYTTIVAVALAGLAGLWSALQRAAGATERLYEIIDAVPEIRSPERPRSVTGNRGHVRFRDVEFRYPARPDKPVLEGIDLDIAPGETVALVGHSGSGKTTMTLLVPRLFDTSRGSVEIGGVDVREQDLSELRRLIATVPQDPVLFSGTIAENIGYGAVHADRDTIERAARDANAHDFIMSFPAGYDTLCGERGVQLSGGQRQRIAIARALLVDPTVLILDEATSNLDAHSESLIQEALERLTENRTTIVIAHRLSTVRHADRIVVLHDGRIVEVGRHEELMAQNGAYQRLVEKQLL